jgi:hypothetical protein
MNPKRPGVGLGIDATKKLPGEGVSNALGRRSLRWMTR